MNKYERSHLKAIEKFQRIVAKYYDISTEQVLQLYERCRGVITSNIWEYMMNQIIKELGDNVQTVIVNGITNEWTRANAMNDAVANKVFTGMTLSKEFQQKYYNNHADALKGFIERKTKSGTLSQKVWSYSNQFATNITRAITYSLENGTSARDLAKSVKHLLNNPTDLSVADSPGQGVYRSAQKNAMRLARSEINMAYRTADYLRIQDEDFVVGIRVVKSNNHPQDDICDSLSAEVGSEANKGKGCYPKDFKFTGWHPHCRCHTETILKTNDELMIDNKLILQGKEPLAQSQNAVTDLPKEFKDYIKENGKAIAKSNSKPYWYTDNEKRIKELEPKPPNQGETYAKEELKRAVMDTVQRAQKVGKEVQYVAEEIAAKHNAICTPINYKSPESITRKVLLERDTKPHFMPDMLKDTVRTTIIADKFKVKTVLQELQQLDNLLYVKPQNTILGYSGNIVNLKMSNGLVGEIQVNTAKMIYAKEPPQIAKSVLGEKLYNQIQKETGIEGGKGHRYYEEWRAMSKEEKQSVKGQKLLRKSREYYSHFNQ